VTAPTKALQVLYIEPRAAFTDFRYVVNRRRFYIPPLFKAYFAQRLTVQLLLA
jgi:hypothetical protein